MNNQELINSICYMLIEKNLYVDLGTIATVFSYLDEKTLKAILNDLDFIKD